MDSFRSTGGFLQSSKSLALSYRNPRNSNTSTGLGGSLDQQHHPSDEELPRARPPAPLDDSDDLEDISTVDGDASTVEGDEHEPHSFRTEGASSYPSFGASLVEATIQVLADFSYKDPLIALASFYKRKGISDIVDNYFDTASKQRFKKHTHVSCEFICPLTGEEYKSSMAAALCEEVVDPIVVDLHNKVLGTPVVHRGAIYYPSVRGARRSIAFRVLERHGALGRGGSNSELSSLSETIAMELFLTEPPAEYDEEGRGGILPTWVHELHALGVRKVHISYQEYNEPPAPVEQTSPPSLSWPKATMICCSLSINEPFQLKVVGSPTGTKHDAVENAMGLLTESVPRIRQHDNMAWKPPSLREINARKNKSDLDNLLRSNSSTTTFVSPLPLWATADFDIADPRRGKKQKYIEDGGATRSGRHPVGTAYLYELRVHRFSGKLLSSKEAATSINGVVRVGLLASRKLLEADKKDQAFASLRKELKSVAGLEVESSCKMSLSKDDYDMLVKFCNIAQDPITYYEQGKLGDLPFWREGRSCILVPLKQRAKGTLLDWQTVRQVCNPPKERIPYLREWDKWQLPFLGAVGLRDLSGLLVAVSLFLFVYGSFNVAGTLSDGTDLYSEFVAGTLRFGKPQQLLLTLFGWSELPESTAHMLWDWSELGMLFALLAFVLHYMMPFKKAVPFNELWNHLLIDISGAARGRREVFLLSDHTKQKDLPFLSVIKRTGQLRTKQRRRSSSRNSIGIHGKSIEVLPFPLDFARAVWNAHKFLPQVEKDSEWLGRAASLLALADKTTFPLVRNHKQGKFSVKRTPKQLLRLLKEATGISNPCTYQRLEFFGDAVLGYFLSVNLMSRNSSLKWDFDELSNLISDGSNNAILYEAALRCGMGDFVLGAQETKNRQTQGTLTDSLFVPQRKFSSKLEIGDKKLSDLAESLLGMAYLYDRNGNMVVGLLNGMCVPLPYHVGKLQTDGWPWFSAMGPCIKSGFPFSIDKTWQRQLVSVGTSLYCKKSVIDRLESNFGKLVDLCASISGRIEIRKALNIQSSKIMLMCALFDDSLRETDDSAALSSGRDDGSLTSQSLSSVENSLSESTSSRADSSSLDSAPSLPSVGRSLERGIYHAAMLRDNLSLIGLHALRLCVSEELIERYPDANEGDLTMLRSCATNDDVLAYIMAKAGIHSLLFDQSATSISRFLLAAKNAEQDGAELWKERGGWIVRGGADEFRRRWQQPSWPTQYKKPQYTGLGRGRLFGRTRKLTSGITGDLVFSFKAIVGALVLAVGLEGMWLCVGPLLEENMLLSAEEVRMAYPVGSSKGRT